MRIIATHIFCFLCAYLLLTGCQSKEPFDSSKWKEKGLDWQITDVREAMVDDLIASNTLIGMPENEIVQILGMPESYDESEMIYVIREKYGADIDPEYISKLRIELDEQARATKCHIITH